LLPWQATKLLSAPAELLEKAQEIVKKSNEMLQPGRRLRADRACRCEAVIGEYSQVSAQEE
jgi:hypothetical protein